MKIFKESREISSHWGLLDPGIASWSDCAYRILILEI